MHHHLSVMQCTQLYFGCPERTITDKWWCYECSYCKVLIVCKYSSFCVCCACCVTNVLPCLMPSWKQVYYGEDHCNSLPWFSYAKFLNEIWCNLCSCKAWSVLGAPTIDQQMNMVDVVMIGYVNHTQTCALGAHTHTYPHTYTTPCT